MVESRASHVNAAAHPRKRPGGVSMASSSGLGGRGGVIDGWLLVGLAVAEHGVEDVDAASG